MSLKSWVDHGWLIPYKTGRKEISDLMRIAERDLKDSKVDKLSNDWRFTISYNAALQLATASLAAAGYRATRVAHHYRIIQSLKFTLGLDDETILLFDTFRKKRNISDYERPGAISDIEVEEIHKLAEDIFQMITEWLKKNHPEFI